MYTSWAIYNKIVILLMMSAFFCCDPAPSNVSHADVKIKTNEMELHEQPKIILFFGNSLTAGYGLNQGEDLASLIQQKIDSSGLPYKTVNGGVSGETTAGGLTRISWSLKQPVDVFVLELGANDAFRGLKLRETKNNLQKILDKVKTSYPDAKLVIAGMQMPPSLGNEYSEEFRKIYIDLAKENHAVLIPFLLEKIAGEAAYNQPDGVHPNKSGARIMAENVWQVLIELL
jgi:acyl-CoA thioesterase-1